MAIAPDSTKVANHFEVRMALDDFPPRKLGFKFGKIGVTWVIFKNMTDSQIIQTWHKCSVNFGASDDENLPSHSR